MNALLDHVWGESRPADRVWSHVTGMRPLSAVRRKLMVLQAFIDDSVDSDSGVYVLAGHIATAENWAKFSAEWENALLKFGTLSGNGGYHFKMAEMAAVPDRMDRVKVFYRILEKYVQLSISFKFNIDDLTRARSRSFVIGRPVDFGFMTDPTAVALRMILDDFHNARIQFPDLLSDEERVDFIFDETKSGKKIVESWARYIEERPAYLKDFYGSVPRFEDDKEFLPLQAADFWAWWARKWYLDGAIEKMDTCDFGTWRESRSWPRLSAECSEDDLVDFMKRCIEPQLNPGESLGVAKCIIARRSLVLI